MKPIARKENLFFLGALFALALAGDMIWWQSRQMSDEMEASASIYSTNLRRDYSEYHDLDLVSQEIDALDADASRELDTLREEQQ